MSETILNFPNQIRINRIADYHTHYVGRIRESGGLFWGILASKSLQTLTRHFSVVFLFSQEGKFLHSIHTSSDVRPTSDAELARLVKTLGPVKFQNIKVDLFTTLIEGIVFGLVPNPDSGFINLQPGSIISFYPPWDGEYWT